MTSEYKPQLNYQNYLDALKETNFTGDIALDIATRITMATDSSIYQVLPQAVCFPRSEADISILMQLASEERFQDIQFSPRGGGTGTNGQSLTSGIIIDFSRHMTKILEVNLEENYVRIEPGVVLDQLNHHLQQHGVFFAPSVSTSSHATLGGMFATDACGKGSCHYGQTSDHVINATIILSNGEIANTSQPTTNNTLNKIFDEISALIFFHKNEIQQKFSNLPRHLTGYNLGQAIENDFLNLNYLLSGSEGTLAIVSELKLKLTKKPSFTALLVVKYDSFDSALRHAKTLLKYKPTAIETLDEHILSVSRENFLEQNDDSTKAINLVEINDEVLLNELSNFLTDTHKQYFITKDKNQIAMFWEFRKRSVGILANLSGKRQPIPFVEDTAVPPEHLADYIAEFREVLESYGLSYGMFGHADAGCIHVRPALDMKDAADTKLIPIITQKIYNLIKKYNGLMWSEHGRGFRSQQVADFFGETLYGVVRQIKTSFDPYNQFNPGKIASSLKKDQALVSISGPYRGDEDKKINKEMQDDYYRTIRCNGNGACFNYANDALICPSYHATKDRVQSPKGRSALLREWLKLESENKPSEILTKAVYDAMKSCVGCKACASRCPVHVDIPEYKSRFLEKYHRKFKRSFKDYLIVYAEFLLPYLMLAPKFSNFLSCSWILKRLGLVNMPKFATTTLKRGLKSRKVQQLTPEHSQNNTHVVALLIDPFIAAFKPSWALDTYDLLTKLGFKTFILPSKPTGKPAHAKGMLKLFTKIANKNNVYYSKISKQNIPIITIDPALGLCFRDEYKKTLDKTLNFNVQLLPEFLSSCLDKWKHLVSPAKNDNTYFFFTHCTEKSLVLPIVKYWLDVFKLFGINIKPIKSSCCGMAGSFGYEAENQAISKKLFDLSWQLNINDMKKNDIALVTGFSCACQVENLSSKIPKHPATALLELIK